MHTDIDGVEGPNVDHHLTPPPYMDRQGKNPAVLIWLD